MKIYLVAGKSGSGKNEVARIIKDYYEAFGKRVVITEFSKYLKLYAKEVLGWDGVNEDKPRRFLQDLGVTIRENMEMPNFLIDRMKEDIKVYTLYYDIVVISDVRLPEEIEEFKAAYSNCVSIYVINQFEESKLSLKEQMHITETALENYDNFDLTITNDDKKTLESKVMAYLEGGK